MIIVHINKEPRWILLSAIVYFEKQMHGEGTHIELTSGNAAAVDEAPADVKRAVEAALGRAR